MVMPTGGSGKSNYELNNDEPGQTHGVKAEEKVGRKKRISKGINRFFSNIGTGIQRLGSLMQFWKVSKSFKSSTSEKVKRLSSSNRGYPILFQKEKKVELDDEIGEFLSLLASMDRDIQIKEEKSNSGEDSENISGSTERKWKYTSKIKSDLKEKLYLDKDKDKGFNFDVDFAGFFKKVDGFIKKYQETVAKHSTDKERENSRLNKLGEMVFKLPKMLRKENQKEVDKRKESSQQIIDYIYDIADKAWEKQAQNLDDTKLVTQNRDNLIRALGEYESELDQLAKESGNEALQKMDSINQRLQAIRGDLSKIDLSKAVWSENLAPAPPEKSPPLPEPPPPTFHKDLEPPLPNREESLPAKNPNQKQSDD